MYAVTELLINVTYTRLLIKLFQPVHAVCPSGYGTGLGLRHPGCLTTSCYVTLDFSAHPLCASVSPSEEGA